jgi:hypothetical protein
MSTDTVPTNPVIRRIESDCPEVGDVIDGRGAVLSGRRWCVVSIKGKRIREDGRNQGLPFDEGTVYFCTLREAIEADEARQSARDAKKAEQAQERRSWAETIRANHDA